MTESTAAAARAVLLSDAPLLGRLYSDWLAGDAELSAALASSTLDPCQFHASSAAAGLGESAPDLWEAVLEQNRRLGASTAALELGARPVRDVGAELLREASGPASARVAEAWRSAAGRARDFGELFPAFLMALLPDWPFLAIDARLPELRAASTPLFRKYLERREGV